MSMPIAANRSMFGVFDVAGSAMGAESVRLNTVASNLSNASVSAGSAEEAYRSRHPVFATIFNQQSPAAGGVRVLDITESQAPPVMRYAPDNPVANEDGYVFMPNVNVVEEMVNMMSASRSYQNNVEVLNTSKDMLLRTLQIGQ